MFGLALIEILLAMSASSGASLAAIPIARVGQAEAREAAPLSMRELYARSETRFAAGDVRGALGDLDEILARPSLGQSECAVRIAAARYLRQLGRAEDALTYLSIAERLTLEAPTEDTPTDLCHIAGERTLAYLGLGAQDLATRELDETKERLRLAREREAADLPREEVFALFVEAVYLKSLEQHAWLDEWLTPILESDFLFEQFPEHREGLRLIRGLSRRELSRTVAEVEPSAREDLEHVANAEHTLHNERVRAEHHLGALAIARGDWKEADTWLARSAARMSADVSRRNPRAHLLHTTLALRVALDADRPDALPSAQRALELAVEDEIEVLGSSPPRRGGEGALRYVQLRSAVSELCRGHLSNDPEHGPARALSLLLRVQDTGTLVRRLGAGETTLEEVRRALLGDDSGRALLVYLVSAERTHLFVVTTTGVTHSYLALQDRIESAASKLHRMLGRPSAPERLAVLRAQAAELRDLVLPPEARERLTELPRVTFVGDTFLTPVPFEVLPFGEGTLGTELAVDNLSSVNLGVRLARRLRAPVDPSDNDVVVLIGDLDSDSLGETAKAGAEIPSTAPESIVGVYAEGTAVCLAGDRATRSALRAHVGGSEALQFLTHGASVASRERPTGLRLTPDESGSGFLGADEIEGLDGQAALDAPSVVILSACRSGVGPARVGDGGSSDLTGAFFTAGPRTRCVLVSSFDLDVEATCRLSALFHDGLAAGRSPAEAMRAARESLAADERFADPFYHSLVRVVGIGQAPVFR